MSVCFQQYVTIVAFGVQTVSFCLFLCFKTRHCHMLLRQCLAVEPVVGARRQDVCW